MPLSFFAFCNTSAHMLSFVNFNDIGILSYPRTSIILLLLILFLWASQFWSKFIYNKHNNIPGHCIRRTWDSCNFFLYPHIKRTPKEQRFSNIEVVAVSSKNYWDPEVLRSLKRWRDCIIFEDLPQIPIIYNHI